MIFLSSFFSFLLFIVFYQQEKRKRKVSQKLLLNGCTNIDTLKISVIITFGFGFAGVTNFIVSIAQ